MLGRLVAFAAIGGVLAAAMVIPVVAATGVLVRNQADKFTTLSLSAQGLPQRSEILDRNGHLLAYVYGVDTSYYTSATHARQLKYFGKDRQPVSYDQISTNMVNALVAIEDSRYWEHGAIDLRGTIRAAVNDLQHKAVQGGSTIAQQYVKNVLLLEAEQAANTQAAQAADAATLNRKLNELRMAVAAEHQQSKQDIVAGYLNDAYYGNFAYGIEAAAETYFGISAAKLSVTQAATLAGIVENPSKYDPVRNPAVALERRNTVLARMATTNNGITAAQSATYQAKPLGLQLLHPRERLPVQFGGHGRLLLPVRGAGVPARPGLRQDADGPGQAARHRRPEDLHHPEPAGPAGREQRGELRGTRPQRHLQPGAQRGHRGRGAAGHRPDHGPRRRPAVRHGPRPDRDQLRGEHPLRLQLGSPDRFLVQAVHPDHRAEAEHPVRLHHERARQPLPSPAIPTARAARPASTRAWPARTT